MIIPAFEPQTKISPFDPSDKRVRSVRCCDLQDTPGELLLTPHSGALIFQFHIHHSIVIRQLLKNAVRLWVKNVEDMERITTPIG